MKTSRFLAGALLALVSLPAFAATEKEMEEARTYAAQAYLRYANDASGYLDEIKATTMSELKGKLKAQELENLKTFEAVALPKDYASWDKAKLSEYWSATFFSSPGLIEKGKHPGAKSRVKRKIEAMTVTAGAAQPAAEQPKNDREAASADPLEGLEVDPNAAAEAASALPDSIEQTARRLEEAMAEEEAARAGGNSYTWVYVGILVALIGVVIWLVIFASKVMKRGEERGEGFTARDYPDDSEMADNLRQASARNSALTAENTAIKAENATLRAENTTIKNEASHLREECRRLSSECESLRERLRLASRPQPAAAPTPKVPTPAPSAPSPRPAAAPVQPQAPAAVQQHPAPQGPRTIFLARANARGLFVRADRKLNIGHTIFRLDTSDGFAGTFRVAADPMVWEMALLNPGEALAGACIAPDLEDTAGMSRVVTESPGTAIFENGCWRVIRKAKIRYE